jgi:hypothetical protein
VKYQKSAIMHLRVLTIFDREVQHFCFYKTFPYVKLITLVIHKYVIFPPGNIILCQQNFKNCFVVLSTPIHFIEIMLINSLIAGTTYLHHRSLSALLQEMAWRRQNDKAVFEILLTKNYVAWREYDIFMNDKCY